MEEKNKMFRRIILTKIVNSAILSVQDKDDRIARTMTG